MGKDTFKKLAALKNRVPLNKKVEVKLQESKRKLTEEKAAIALEALRGPRGFKGEKGDPGKRGEKGDRGSKGDKGDKPILGVDYRIFHGKDGADGSFNIGSGDGLFLKLDQSVAQTVINGLPIFEDGLIANDIITINGDRLEINDGQNNCCIGINTALNKDVNSSHNTFIGDGVAEDGAMDDAHTNVGIGYHTLYGLTTGDGNIGIGGYCLSNVRDGKYNTAVGYMSIANGGEHNTMFGYCSGANITGNSNLCLGSYTGYRSTAVNNIFFLNNTDDPLVNAAAEISNSLMYGVFNATVANQTLRINAGNFSIHVNDVEEFTMTATDLELYSNNIITTGIGTFGSVHTPEIKTDTSIPTDLSIVTGADKTLVLDTVVYEDIRITSGSLDRPGVTDPTFQDWQPDGSGTTFSVLKFNQNQYGTFTCQLPHAYKEGSSITAHVHWTPGDRGVAEDTKTVAWKLDYSWANINSVFASSKTVDLTDTCDGVNDKHLMTPDLAIDGTTVICDSYTGAGSATYSMFTTGYIGLGQAFTGDGRRLYSVTFEMVKTGTPPGAFTVNVYEDTLWTYGSSMVPYPDATPIATLTYTADDIPVGTNFVNFVFDSDNRPVLIDGVYYVATVEYANGASTSLNCVGLRSDHIGSTHDGNQCTRGTGFPWGYGDGDRDLPFYVYTCDEHISSMIIGKIYRDNDDTWVGTNVNGPALLEIDFHFPVNTLGSRTRADK